MTNEHWKRAPVNLSLSPTLKKKDTTLSLNSCFLQLVWNFNFYDDCKKLYERNPPETCLYAQNRWYNFLLNRCVLDDNILLWNLIVHEPEKKQIVVILYFDASILCFSTKAKCDWQFETRHFKLHRADYSANPGLRLMHDVFS